MIVDVGIVNNLNCMAEMWTTQSTILSSHIIHIAQNKAQRKKQFPVSTVAVINSSTSRSVTLNITTNYYIQFPFIHFRFHVCFVCFPVILWIHHDKKLTSPPVFRFFRPQTPTPTPQKVSQSSELRNCKKVSEFGLRSCQPRGQLRSSKWMKKNKKKHTPKTRYLFFVGILEYKFPQTKPWQNEGICSSGIPGCL